MVRISLMDLAGVAGKFHSNLLRDTGIRQTADECVPQAVECQIVKGAAKPFAFALILTGFDTCSCHYFLKLRAQAGAAAEPLL